MYMVGFIGRRLMPRVLVLTGAPQSAYRIPSRYNPNLGVTSINVSALHGHCFVSGVCARSSAAVLAHTPRQAVQLQAHGSMYGSAAALSSISSTSELSAAIAEAPTHAALQSLATAASLPQQLWLAQDYKVQLLSSLGEWRASDLVKALLFYAKLGPGHEDLFQEAVPVLYNQLGGLSPPDLLRLLTAFSTAAQHSPAAYSQELYAALTEFLWESLGQLQPGDLADIAAAYAAVQHYDDDEDFFNGLAAAAVQKVEAFCPEDLSRLCWSLSHLRYSSPGLNTAALNQLSHQVEVWPLSCVGRVLSALARVQACPDPCTLERVASHVSVVLRNMRTSTDGQKVLQSLTAKARAENPSSSSSSSSNDGVGSWQGLGSSNYGPVAEGPTWQGFGMMRSSSSSSSSSFSSSDSSHDDGGGLSSITSSNGNGAAAIWEAANASSCNYEYSEDNPLGPEFTTVTSYGADGKVVTTYIKHNSVGGSNNGSNGRSIVVAAPGGSGKRAFSSSSDTSASRGSWYNQVRASQDECPIANLRNVPVPDNCRPIYDTAEALQCALVNLVWSFAMLGHLHGNMARECFKALGLAPAEAFSDDQLVMLWSAHMRYQQLGHVMLDPNPLLAESYSVFMKEVSRAAPRTITLPIHLQPIAAASYLLYTVRQSPEYEQQQQHEEPEQQQQRRKQQQFSSWKFRDPAVLSIRGLEASVRQCLDQLDLAPGAPCITLDGVERVGLPLKHNGVSVAWQVIPPAWCSRNPPYTPTCEAQLHKWALQYRGYTVLQVPFHEWAGVLESGDTVVQAGYLQNMLNGLGVRVPRTSNF